MGRLRTANDDERPIVDPEKRAVEWLALTDDGSHQVECGSLIDLSTTELPREIEWPDAPVGRYFTESEASSLRA